MMSRSGMAPRAPEGGRHGRHDDRGGSRPEAWIDQGPVDVLVIDSVEKPTVD